MSTLRVVHAPPANNIRHGIARQSIVPHRSGQGEKSGMLRGPQRRLARGTKALAVAPGFSDSRVRRIGLGQQQAAGRRRQYSQSTASRTLVPSRSLPCARPPPRGTLNARTTEGAASCSGPQGLVAKIRRAYVARAQAFLTSNLILPYDALLIVTLLIRRAST